MLTFSWTPSSQSTTVTPRVNAAQAEPYGAEQREEDGLNAMPRSYALSFRRASDLAAIAAFLTARRGVEAFYFRPFGEVAAASMVCRSWARQQAPGGADMITATFETVAMADSAIPAVYAVPLLSNGSVGMEPGYTPTADNHLAHFGFLKLVAG